MLHFILMRWILKNAPDRTPGPTEQLFWNSVNDSLTDWRTWLFTGLIVLTVIAVHEMGPEAVLEFLRGMFDHECLNPRGVCL